jgi:hypothetical protein
MEADAKNRFKSVHGYGIQTKTVFLAVVMIEPLGWRAFKKLKYILV